MIREKLEIPHVEKPVCDWADRHLIVHRKFNGAGRRHWPDRGFFLPRAHLYLIEFKRPGKAPNEAQADMIGTLRGLGYDVDWFDNKEDAIAALLLRLRKVALHVLR